jgi:hypothetical protein
MVDWLFVMGQTFKLAQVTIHTAICYYDNFTDKGEGSRAFS